LDLHDRLSQIKEDCIAASDEVAAAMDSGEDARELAAGKRVHELVARYKALLAEVPAHDHDRVERIYGRRVTDLRRAAESLTRRMGGTSVKRAVDAGSVPFVEQRPVSKSIVPPRHAATRDTPRYSVGRETEAWCGKCRDFKEHHIVAMVGDMPKQVICTVCRSRHGYRTEPGRAADKAALAATPEKVQAQAPARYVDPEAARLAEQKRKLNAELDAVESPRAFDPRARYKANEIIVHPEWGRGKVENVIKGSMLVRFRDKLRPIDLK
jgi:hypothetical protein